MNQGISRRNFLIATAGVSAAAAIGFIPSIQAKQHWLVSACTDRKRQHHIAAFDLHGNLINQFPLPARGHGVVALPNKPGCALVVARRPGEYLMEVDFVAGKINQLVKPQAGHLFYGHAVVKDDVLITTENLYDQAKGQVVIRDLQNLQVLESYDSGGIGPHEPGLMPDGKTLVIANGGIQTHPNEPRKKLNLDTMQPNLSYLDIASGKILASYQLDNHHLSIRHLDVAENGKVIAGLQYQGSKMDLVPLAISHNGEDSLQYLKADDDVWRSLNHYTASICCDEANNQVAISCPRADKVTFWDLTTDQFLSERRLADGAGLTNMDGIVASSGKGIVIQPNDASSDDLKFNALMWDNHMTNIVSA